MSEHGDAGTTYRIIAEWDPEARVWVATSDDVPGLVVEAATLEALVDDLRATVPELLMLNNVPHERHIKMRLRAERNEALALA